MVGQADYCDHVAVATCSVPGGMIAVLTWPDLAGGRQSGVFSSELLLGSTLRAHLLPPAHAAAALCPPLASLSIHPPTRSAATDIKVTEAAWPESFNVEGDLTASFDSIPAGAAVQHRCALLAGAVMMAGSLLVSLPPSVAGSAPIRCMQRGDATLGALSSACNLSWCVPLRPDANLRSPSIPLLFWHLQLQVAAKQAARLLAPEQRNCSPAAYRLLRVSCPSTSLIPPLNFAPAATRWPPRRPSWSLCLPPLSPTSPARRRASR